METELFYLTQHLLLTSITFQPITTGVTIALIALVILLLMSGLLSGSEVAYFSLSPADIHEMEDKGHRRDRLVLKHLKDPETLLATILIGNNFVNVGIVILSAFISNSLIQYGDPYWVKVLIEIVGITAIILFFGEIFPKVYATRFSLKFAETMAYPLVVLKSIFSPLSLILVKSSDFVNKHIVRKYGSISLDDISHALEITSEDITEEKEILESIVKFGNTSADEIMTARVNVVDIELNSDFNKVLSVIVEDSYSRIPIFENTPDKVKGVLYVKDVLPHLNEKNDFNWQGLIREPYFIPETKKINDLLEEFKLNKIHMAIVVDEYGGTSGIVTLEDILEEIVGEISDEQDEDESFYTKLPDGSFVFDAQTLLNDFYKVTGTNELDFEKVRGEAETLAGLILEIKGEIPDRNEKIKFKKYLFTIVSVDSRRIIQVKFEDKSLFGK